MKSVWTDLLVIFSARSAMEPTGPLFVLRPVMVLPILPRAALIAATSTCTPAGCREPATMRHLLLAATRSSAQYLIQSASNLIVDAAKFLTTLESAASCVEPA